MESVLEVLEQMKQAQIILQDILGFDPVLIVPVFLIMSVIRSLFDLTKDSGWKRSLLGMLTIFVSAAVNYVTTKETDTVQFAKHSVILGSIVALCYNMIKGVLQWTTDKLFQKMEQSTGKDYEEPEDLL